MVGIVILILCVSFVSMFIMLNLVIFSLNVFSVKEKIIFFILFVENKGVCCVLWL